MSRDEPRRTRGRSLATSWLAAGALASMLAMPKIALGQLRPYEPAEWTVFDGDATFVGELGATLLVDQHASLAGEVGTLREVGVFSAFYRTGRVAIGAEGTLHRHFERDRTVGILQGGAEADEDGTRQDSGDYRVSTVVRLTPEHSPALAVIRFGTRLPTTANEAGLERDRMDFFAIAGGRYDRGPLRAAAELGVGIHGTRAVEYEQSDVFIYLVSVGLPRSLLAPSLILTGHADGMPDLAIPGNEELAEIRLRLRSGGDVWVQAEAIAGLLEFSPDRGISLMLGATL